MTRATRHYALSTLFIGTLVIATVANVWSALEHRRSSEQDAVNFQREVDHQEKMRLVRQMEAQERGKALYELHQIRELAKQTVAELKER
jgi:hypothetical protein